MTPETQENLLICAVAAVMFVVVALIIRAHQRQDARDEARRATLHADIDREMRTPQ